MFQCFTIKAFRNKISDRQETRNKMRSDQIEGDYKKQKTSVEKHPRIYKCDLVVNSVTANISTFNVCLKIFTNSTNCFQQVCTHLLVIALQQLSRSLLICLLYHKCGRVLEAVQNHISFIQPRRVP